MSLQKTSCLSSPQILTHKRWMINTQSCMRSLWILFWGRKSSALTGNNNLCCYAIKYSYWKRQTLITNNSLISLCRAQWGNPLIIDHTRLPSWQTHSCGAPQLGKHSQSFEGPDCYVCWTWERLQQYAGGQGARDVGSQVIPLSQATGELRDWSLSQAAVLTSKNYVMCHTDLKQR